MNRVLLFDIDNTLIDFREASRIALCTLFERAGLAYSEAVYQTFDRINDRLWKEHELGKIDKETIHRVRFERIFSELHIEHDPHPFEEEFCFLISETTPLVEGAESLVKTCKALGYVLCVASNTSAWRQEKRLRKCGLRQYFDHAFYSESVGATKPSEAFFLACLGQIGCKKEDLMMIGDSLSADIRGGREFGIRTCWLNRFGEEGEADEVFTTLAEIEALLRREAEESGVMGGRQ